MAFLTAGSLDTRNVGANVKIELEDRILFGTIVGLIRHKDEPTVTIYLADDEDPVELPATARVDVHLHPYANYSAHAKNAIEEILDLLQSKLVSVPAPSTLTVVNAA